MVSLAELEQQARALTIANNAAQDRELQAVAAALNSPAAPSQPTPKAVLEAANEALQACSQGDPLKAGQIVLQGDSYLPKPPTAEAAPSTSKTFGPLNITDAYAAQLFAADRKK